MASQPIHDMRINPESDGARAYAFRSAAYIKDAEYIHRLTVREHGPKFAPTVETIRAMQEHHRRQRERFAAQANSLVQADPYIPENDNGEDWCPRGLVRLKPPKPKAKEPPALPENIPVPVSKQIIHAVARAYDMTVADLISKRRSRRLICARAIAIRLLRDLTWNSGLPRFSYPQIGRMMGGRDHTTILYSIQVFDAYCKKYPEMREVYDALKGRDW